MCGICGKLSFDPATVLDPQLLRTMANTIRHRGPDDEGFYVNGQIGLGFRRLSIIDLNTGHQPISNEDDTIWIVFNGEIYNYQELRAFLLDKGHVFRTETDTEVIVHLYEELGFDFLKRLRGMFAFALWDARKKLLLLARDRVGIKPVYYSRNANGLVFASEIKAILADPGVRTEINPAMVDRFLSFYYLPGEETLLKGICKLPPGHFLVAQKGGVEIRQYWDLEFAESPAEISVDLAEEQLLSLLDEAVQLHMISDVPVGFLLSGGVDSTALLSFATEKTQKRISSFTVGFTEPGFTDERPYAALAAKRFGTVHYDMTISARDFVDFLPRYVWHMEEPVCEPPAVALYYVSKLASQHVKVLISGEGGDEAFAGYPNYRYLLWLERIKKLLRPLGSTGARAARALQHLTGSRRVAKYADLMDVPLEDYYLSRASSPFTFFNRHAPQFYSKDFSSHVDKTLSTRVARDLLQRTNHMDTLSKMLYVDTKTWLPDDLLVKADKITMANSVELRVPFLDHFVLEFAASLPSHLKVAGWQTKYLAKRALTERVPKEILNRRKTGFPVPYETWLRKDLKDWLSDILLERRAMERGYFEKREVEALIEKNRENGAYSKEIFSLAVLELWHRIFLEKEAVGC